MPIQAREDLGTDLYARDFETELFVRMPHPPTERAKLPGYCIYKPRGEDTYDLWERMDLDELE